MEVKKHIGVDSDLSYCSFYTALEVFKKEFGFLPNKLIVGTDNIDLAKSILKYIAPEDYKEIKDKIDLGFEFHLNNDFPDYYWQVEGVKDNNKHIVFSLGIRI